MKGKFIKDDKGIYSGKLELNQVYDILKVYDNNEFCTVKQENGEILEWVYFNRFEPIYEKGDMVKIIKNIDDGSYNKQPQPQAEVGRRGLISKTYNLVHIFPYLVEDCKFYRCAEELEIINTKYELEQENEPKLQRVKRNEEKSGITFCRIITNNTYNTYNTYKKDELLKVTKGLYKDFEGTFVDYVKGYDKVLIRLDELNVAYVDREYVERVKKPVNNTHVAETKTEFINGIRIEVQYQQNKTKVRILGTGYEGVALCDPDTEFNETRGKELAFLRAYMEKYRVSINDLEADLREEKTKLEQVKARIRELSYK